ncbi:MAG: ABC transporter ATP-binding protein [Candidatus Rokubacteria bacterium]|nr:ABC transporter ATP-binding protein [Candidatus Rokubacteria bacterium]
MTKLTLRNVSRTFGSVVAVDDFSLALAQGEFVALLGPSGCGKTTTLRMIAGLLDPSAGTIEMDGEVISSPGSSLPPEKRKMSMIFQSYAIWPNMTVAENVAFGLQVRRRSRAETQAKVEQILDVVQMRHLRDRYPAELSGGQQQRVALARAIVVQPAVLSQAGMDFQSVLLATCLSAALTTFLMGFLANYPIALAPGMGENFFFVYTLGRTNFLDGEVRDGAVAFDRFAIGLEQFAEAPTLSGRVSFSLRPQSIRLLRLRPPASSGSSAIPGHVVQRAYLGEHWDYVVRPADSGLQLRVTARPHEVFEVGETVWLELDPRQMAHIQ